MAETNLQSVWEQRKELWIKATKLWIEGNKLSAYIETCRLWAEARKLWEEADVLWLEAIHSKYGDIAVEWVYNKYTDEEDCVLGNGEKFVMEEFECD